MEELKKFELNNRILEDFDKLMNFHLDKVEELVIKEIFDNPKLYNIISLCTNLKTLVVEGDLRIDVNKIVFNICKPEKLETIILNSVKLPTNKTVQKFTSLKTISFTNITFSDINSFFDKLPDKEKLIALNLTNVDLGRKSISICSQFPNLKYLNLDRINNCKFDDFDFIYENKKMSRFEFYNNEISLDKINSLCRGRYTKKISVNVETNKNSFISNAFEINDDGEICITVNTSDLEQFIEEVKLYKVDNLFIILEDNIEIENYIRNFKKVKGKVTLAIRDISYLSSEIAKRFEDKLGVEFINILDNRDNLEIDYNKYCYPVKEYIQIREKIDEIISNISSHSNDIDKFNDLYSYIKNNIKYTMEEASLKEALINKKCSHNLYAVLMNSCLNLLKLDSKIINGISYGIEYSNWNQVKLDNDWYNFDIASEIKAKNDKKFFKYVFKGNLFNDEQFYKNHTIESGNPEICNVLLEEKKKELKNSVKKVSFIGKVIIKLKSIFSFNKKKALPAPEDNSKK